MAVTKSRWLSPMLATLTHETFSHPEWLFETKLDGQRFLAFRDGDDVRLTSRNRDGRLRHPRFKGLRRDKRARDVTRETPGA